MTIFPFSDDHDFSPNPSFNFSCAPRSPLTSKFLQIILLFIKKRVYGLKMAKDKIQKSKLRGVFLSRDRE